MADALLKSTMQNNPNGSSIAMRMKKNRDTINGVNT